LSLKRLIQKCKQKDREAQETVYRRYAGKLFTLCLKYSGSFEEVEDNLQDGFLKIFSKIDQFKGKGSFEGWMTRIMINTTLKKYQNRTMFLVSIDEEHLEAPEVEIDEEKVSGDFLLQIIQELPDSYRLVFNLYAMDGYSHKEIAEMLQITVGTSKSNLARARQKLRERIETEMSSNSVRSL